MADQIDEIIDAAEDAPPRHAMNGDARPSGGAHRQKKKQKPTELPEVVRLSDVEPRPVAWLWSQRFALGKLSIIAGHPGLGKSQLAIYLAARVSTGTPWPCNTGTAPLGNAIVLSAEDDVADTMRPRLDAAGGDASRVHALQAIKQIDEEGKRGFDLTRDVEHLMQVVNAVGDVKLIIIDPISAYMGKPGANDSNRNTDVRAILAPLQDLAARLDIAIIMVSHLTKGTRDGAVSRVTGSGAFVAAARAAFLIEKEMEKDEDAEDGKGKLVDTGRRLFLPIKNNLGDDKTGFAYKIVSKTNVYDAFDPPMEIQVAAIEWADEIVTITADEVLAPTGEKSSGASEVREFLKSYLSSGPMPQKQVEAAAAQRGFSEDQLKRAKKKLNVASEKQGGLHNKRGVWMWCLPGDKRGTQGDLADIVLGGGALPDADDAVQQEQHRDPNEPPPVDEDGRPLG